MDGCNKCMTRKIPVFKLPRLYLPQQYSTDKVVDIGREYSHRLSNVLRMRQGEHFRIFNGTSGEYLCEIEEVTKRPVSVRARVLELLRPAAAIGLQSTLYFSPIKKTRQKILVEKATELGVQHFAPVISQNTNFNFSADEWLSVAIAASEQSDQLHIPTISDSIALMNIPSSDTPLLICSERSDIALPINVALQTTLSRSNSISILVGPEGGFTAQEVVTLSQLSNATCVSLGSTVLRAETACLYALSCVSAVYHQLSYKNKFHQ